MSFWHRKNHVDKVYFARVKGTLKEGIEARFQAGLTLKDGTPVRPAELVIEKKVERRRRRPLRGAPDHP